MTVRCVFLLCACVLVGAAGCGSGRTIGGPGSVMPTAEVDFTTQIQPILNKNCALSGCHAADTASGGMILDAGQAYSNLVNATSTEVAPDKRVVPFNSAASYIIEKLTHAQPRSGDQMPRGSAPLPSDEINLIKAWIDQGAKQSASTASRALARPF